jgi:hypothetical protein
MKKVLLVVGLTLLLTLICSIMLYSQVSSWRSNPPKPRIETPRITPSIPQTNDVSRWRNNPSQSNPRGRGRIQNWNRFNQFDYYWGNWGWYQPMPYIWYDNFGFRQRSVIHIYENGRKDTIRKESPYTSFGIGHTNNKQVSFWGVLGRKKSYFILDYTMSYNIDQNQYYPNGRINEVDFPLSKDDFIKQGTLYLGGGKRLGKLGVHGMIGFGNEVIRYQGKDDLGGISFPKSNSNFTTFKIGIIRDFKYLTLKLDRDPIRNFNQISIGLNNK